MNDNLDSRISLQSKFSSENKLSKLHEDMGNFVRFVSWQALQWEEYRFSSGWLNFIKTQHQIIANSSMYNDVNSEHPLIKHIPKVKENYQDLQQGCADFGGIRVPVERGVEQVCRCRKGRPPGDAHYPPSKDQ